MDGGDRVEFKTNFESSMKNLILLLILLCIVSKEQLNTRPSDKEASANTSFETKKEILLKHFADLNSPSFAVCLAKFATESDIDNAVKIFDTLISNPSGDMFFMFQSLMTYLYAKEKMPEWLKQKYRNVWKTYTPYRGDTENHWVMYYASLYLASQEWKSQNATEWFNGKSSIENFKESEEWINKWIEITTTIGQGEFDSPHYLAFFLIPMFMLYEFAEDSLMRLKSQMMLDYLFSDYAVEHLAGSYCGGHSREPQNETLNPREALSSAFAFLYFSDEGFKKVDLNKFGIAVFAAVTSYRLPDVIYHIATDREIAYEHKERKRVRNVIRFGKERNPPVYKYTYMTKDYCIGSLQGGILQPIQQHSWDITFSDSGDYNTVFSLHPYVSEIELGMFFPEEIKILPELVDRAHRTYRNPNKWISSSPYERLFQYKGTLIAMYDFTLMKSWEGYSHVNIFIPRMLEHFEMDTLGWIIGKRGNGYFGIKILGGRLSLMVDSISYSFRVYGDRICLIVEAGGRVDFGDFNLFKSGLKNCLVEFDSVKFSVKYRGLRGFEMLFEYPEGRFLNGKRYDLNWNLFDGPNLKSEGKTIVISWRDKKRILDFENLRIIEE